MCLEISRKQYESQFAFSTILCISPASIPRVSDKESSLDSVIHICKAKRLLEQSYSEIGSISSEE